jgi:hypothetical protein
MAGLKMIESFKIVFGSLIMNVDDLWAPWVHPRLATLTRNNVGAMQSPQRVTSGPPRVTRLDREGADWSNP